MKMKSKKYYSINITVFLMAILFFYHAIGTGIRLLYLKDDWNMVLFLGTFFAILVYGIKALRLYIILLEKRLALASFIRLYIKTTLINLVFPFKLGEIFRMYCYGIEFKNYKRGFLLILIDRYFDTLPLLLLLLVSTIGEKNQVSGVVAVLCVFIILVTVFYWIFPSTYKYLNRFLIMNIESDRGILALDMIRKAQNWYLYAKELIRGREAILLVLSGCAWLAEYAMLYSLVIGSGRIFKAENFVSYINAVFTGKSNEYVEIYICMSGLILAVCAGFAYGRLWFVKKERS